MGLNKLTTLAVKRAKAVNDKGEPVAGRRYSDGGGLYLEVTASGGKSWVFMWKRNGKRRAMGLGSANAISLVDARELARDARKAVTAGELGPSPSPRPPLNAMPTSAPSGRQSGIGKTGYRR
jgi:hypothetical protein